MYLSWNQTTITDFSPEHIEKMYNDGYVFTRVTKGRMDQTRSIRIDLTRFKLSSENRRILKKNEGLTMTAVELPYSHYTWQIGKLGADFYKARNAVFSANKIKELITNSEKSNFNTLLIFNHSTLRAFCIAFQTEHMLHYSYPFYEDDDRDRGLGMMLHALVNAKEQNKKYVYLGSLQRPNDTYKLQFEGAEWFDGTQWTNDTLRAKELLKNV